MSVRACNNLPDISKKTVIASFEEGSTTREFLEGLNDDQWQITSFDSLDRIACFQVTSERGMIHNMSVTLPVISVSSMK